MTAESFTTWLSGFFEMANPTSLNAAQVKLIREKLNLIGNIPYAPKPGPVPTAPLPIYPTRPDKGWPHEWEDRPWPRSLEIKD